MNKKMTIQWIGIAVAALLVAVSMAADRNTYIIQTVEADDTPYLSSSLYSLAPSAKVIYKYQHVLNGYSARLTPDEALALKSMPDVVSVSPETRYELHTTRTPWFLGLDQHADVLPNPKLLSDVIIGVIDSGVWPELKSFDDAGLGPIPSHWRGECETGTNFNKSHCNKKLIGARYFYQAYEEDLGGKMNETVETKSPRDNIGHGTHTSTTAAGSAVSGASLFGYANGTARGMAPQARVAVYKCCWKKGGCYESDVLAAMDKAIDDNVNVMSLSLGGFDTQTPYYHDPVAIGAFSAMKKGIFVSCSAGNGGPRASTLINTAPWLTTVGAGTLDRDFPAPVKLGNGKIYHGVSLYSGNESLGGKFFPLVYAGNVANHNSSSGRFCDGSLIPEKVKGKIVLCEHGSGFNAEKGGVVKAAGGVGTIFADELVVDVDLYLATSLGAKASSAIRKYLSSDPNPTATIFFQGTKLRVQPSPVVAAFSSRGPAIVTPEILKPDLIAPGVGILAGWTGDVSPSQLHEDTRRVPYNIISGTSMSCPHVSGLAALLKAAHPNWSPAAIRSALMTTAYASYKDGNPILDQVTWMPSTPFDYGAGHVNPIAALDPGLVYDLHELDYLKFLCAVNYTSEQISAVAGRTNFTCDNHTITYSSTYLNYPSFAVAVQYNPKGNATVVKYRRKLTNVGQVGTYMVKTVSPSKLVNISVHPWKLSFNRTNQKKSYTVTFSVSPTFPIGTNIFGRIEWRDGNNHVVGSPIAFSWK